MSLNHSCLAVLVFLLGAAYAQIVEKPLTGNGESVTEIPIPSVMTECEGSTCSKWLFVGKKGRARWDGGATGILTIEKFDTAGVIVHRSDDMGNSRGLTAVYTGQLVGNRLEGKVTWTWPGHFHGNSPTGQWFATLPRKESPTGIPLPSKKPFPDRFPQNLSECELQVCGIWTFDGNKGSARWPNGALASLILEHFDRTSIIIKRTDSAESGGITAIYTGKVEGDHIEGKVRRTFPESKLSDTVDWRATAVEGTDFQQLSARVDRQRKEVLAQARVARMWTVVAGMMESGSYNHWSVEELEKELSTLKDRKRRAEQHCLGINYNMNLKHYCTESIRLESEISTVEDHLEKRATEEREKVKQ